MKYDLMTKLGDLLKDPQAVEIIKKYVSGLAKNPMLMAGGVFYNF